MKIAASDSSKRARKTDRKKVAEHSPAMNHPESPHPAELCIQRALEKTEDYVRREPAMAVAAAFGAGLLLKLLPTRAVARPIATVVVKLLPPTLLGLGLLKAFELCCENSHCHARDTVAVDSP